jgi:membrane protease subunit HflK
VKRWLVRLVPAILLVAWLLTGIKEIRPGERAVVRRFGRVVAVVSRPGLWIGLPWGIDRVDRIAVEQVRKLTIGYRPGEGPTEETPPGQLLTGDRNLINVRLTINWKVNPDQVLAYVEQQDRAEELIAWTAEAVLAEWIAGRTVDDVLLKGTTPLREEIRPRMQARLEYCGLGVRVDSVDMTLAPPDNVKADFDRVAEAEAERRTLVQKAREDARTKENAASAKVRKEDYNGDAYAKNRPAEARTEAAEFDERLATYRAYPLVREAGRWTHLLQMVQKLIEAGQIHPLDPELDSPLRK